MRRLDLRLQRLEENEEHDRGEDGVQVHRLEPADDHHEQVEDGRQAEGERRRHEQPSRELVDVGEARARHRLGEDEEEDDREHRADGRQVHAEIREEVGDRERRRRGADHDEEAHAVAHRARGVALPAARQRDERGGEQPEDVRVDGAQREASGRGTARRTTASTGTPTTAANRASRVRVVADLERDDVLEEVDRELRQEHREHAGHALPDVRAEEARERLARVPERDVGREGGEEPVDGASPAQEHAQRDRERQHRAEQDGLRAQVLHARQCRPRRVRVQSGC